MNCKLNDLGFACEECKDFQSRMLNQFTDSGELLAMMKLAEDVTVLKLCNTLCENMKKL